MTSRCTACSLSISCSGCGCCAEAQTEKSTQCSAYFFFMNNIITPGLPATREVSKFCSAAGRRDQVDDARCSISRELQYEITISHKCFPVFILACILGVRSGWLSYFNFKNIVVIQREQETTTGEQDGGTAC